MTTATISQAPFAASPTIARELTHQPNRLTVLVSAAVGCGRAVAGFVSGVIHAPILPVEALLEANVLASMLDDHAHRDPVQSAHGSLFDGSLWRGRE
jgi:hypothetical protein